MVDRPPLPPWESPADFVGHVAVPRELTGWWGGLGGRRRAQRLEQLRQRAVESGVAGHAWHAPLRLPDPTGETPGVLTELFLDARLPDADAERLYGLGMAWALRAAENPALRDRVVETVGYRDAVPLEDLGAGPDSGGPDRGAWTVRGAWLLRGGQHGTPWRLIVVDEVLVVR